jgi:hypothetical protein
MRAPRELADEFLWLAARAGSAAGWRSLLSVGSVASSGFYPSVG